MSALPAVFADLQPAAVWRHFATLCAIPRPSKAEDALREQLHAWAVAKGLDAQVDGAGNLIVRKPASPGREAAPGVVLQAHLDMVCQKNPENSRIFAAQIDAGLSELGGRHPLPRISVGR